MGPMKNDPAIGKKTKNPILLAKILASTDTQNFSNRSQQENANWFQWNSKICQLDTLQKLPQWFPIDPNRSTANSSPLWLLPLHLPGFETTGSPLRRSTSVRKASPVKGEEVVTLLFVSQLHLKTPRYFWHFFWIHQNYIPVDYTFMLFVSELRLKKNGRHFEEFEKLHPQKKKNDQKRRLAGWKRSPPSGFQIGNIYIYRLIHLSGCSSNRHLSFRGVVVDWFLNSDP